MDSLIYLEPVLRAKKVPLTPQEENLMQAWKNRARRYFEFGSLVGGGAAYLVTKRLPRNPRIAICAGTAAVSGVWLLMKSIESTVEHVLSLEGTRLQGELAQLMLKKHQNDPWVQKHVSKYFYPEIVYNDSSVDRAFYRWRYRNAFGDLTANQSTRETDSKEKEAKISNTTTTNETKQVRAGEGGETMKKENAFDLIFGTEESEEDDVPQPDGAAAPRLLSRRQTRKEKRMHRRHRHAHREEESEIRI